MVILRTTSKAWAMAGLRIGFAVSSESVASVLHRVRPMFEVNTIAVEVFYQMLDHMDQVMAAVARINAGKEHFHGSMNQLGFFTIPTHGNFQHVRFGDIADAVHDALEDLVLYRRNFEAPCLRGFSRFTATTVEQFQPVIDRIALVAEKG